MNKEEQSPRTNFIHKLRALFTKKKVTGLVGKSGSGKSFRSLLLVEKHGFDLLIDDGLLIQNQKILSGQTAKSADTYLGAVRIALFESDFHRNNAIRALKSLEWTKMLVLGTSRRMIQIITENLQLPMPTAYIEITDIATHEEIAIAQKYRKYRKSHVIPLPQLEIKKNLPKALSDSLSVFVHRYLSRKNFINKTSKNIEQSIVTPTYTHRSELSINESALTQILMHCVQEFDAAITVEKIIVRQSKREGFAVSLEIKVPFRYDLSASLYEMRQYIITQVQKFVQIYINKLNIIVNSIKN